MNKLICVLSILYFCSFNVSSQNNLDDYKYIVVPTNYDFLKGEDKYQLNSLTEFLFNKYGFTAFLQGEELPSELNENGCLALYVDVKKKKGGLLKTKVQIELKDCNNRVVHSSRIGESREKDFSKAYNVALRDAFVTYQAITYSYKPNNEIVSQSKPKQTEDRVEIEKLQKELEELKAKKQVVESEEPEVETERAEVKVSTNVELPVAKETPTAEVNLLYAQPINNGFQIVDTTPKKVMILYYSGVPDIYIVKDRDAIVYKKGETWVLSENDGTNIKSETLKIKF